MNIQNLICHDNDIRNQFLTHQNTKNASSNRCKSSIQDIFSGNARLAVTKRLHRTNLCSLFLHHSCHRRQTDQSRHQEKQYWKDLANVVNTLRIVTVTSVFGQIISRRNHPFRILEIFKILSGLGKLSLSICDFFLRICLSVLIFFPSILQFFASLLQIFGCRFQLFFIFCYLIFRIFKLLLILCNFSGSIIECHLTRQNFTPSPINLCLSIVNLSLRIV